MKPTYDPSSNVYNTSYSPEGQMKVRGNYIESILNEIDKIRTGTEGEDVFIQNVQNSFRHYGFTQEIVRDLDNVNNLEQLRTFLNSFAEPI
ncbi:MAG: hypothetical protein SFU25_01765 [Candidatus Caenarcaniphilales bacterium]|nr:hypothetical protein [Candidatus Caenarcaniphilales bacterium]